MKKRVAIVGGGLAGIAAAVRLSEHHYQPIILETRKRLGGRATSFVDPRTGDELDNCQHVLLGCCTNYIDLLDRLKVLDHIEWHRTLHWTSGGGVISELSAGWLPAPFHLAMSFNRLAQFTRTEKREIAKAMWSMIRMGATGRFAWRGRVFREFLEECKQSESTVRKFWNTVIISACNMNVDRVAAGYALQVFQEGFLANRWSYVMGLSSVPLAQLYEAAHEMIAAAGGRIQLGVSVRAIAYDGSRVTGVITSDEVVQASSVISAVPFDRLNKMVSDTVRQADKRLQHLDKFEVSPILGVHLKFDREVFNLPHLTLVDRAVHWFFNKGVDEQGRQHLHAVISAADEWMSLTEDQIVERVLADLHSVVPQSRGLRPVEARSVKEKRATFAPTPWSEDNRPGTISGTVGLRGGGISNLFLAGDWVDTGWPATMEGAVRSGYAAATAAMGAEPSSGLIEDIPTSWLTRRLGLR